MARSSNALKEIDALTCANRRRADAAIEKRLAELRHRAFDDLRSGSTLTRGGVTPPAKHARARSIRERRPSEITVETLWDDILGSGCLLVRELASPAQARAFVDGIERALSERDAGIGAAGGSPWYRPLPLSKAESATLGRRWVSAGGGVLIADSPRMLFMLLELLEHAGLRDVVAGYLGERPVLSANKCTLRRVSTDTNAGWHQDGAFLGPGLGALNIWLSLSHCGRDAPGLDLLPRRLNHIVETGTRGAYFDWAVGPEIVAELADETPVVRPIFAPGDALLFDEMFLHQTGVDTAMTRPRYAIETWFFAPSAYPKGHVPVVW